MSFEIEDVVSFDTETTGLHPYLGDLPFGFAFANSVEETYLDDRKDSKEDILKLCLEIFENEEQKVVIHNAKFDMHHLAQWCQSNFKKEIDFKCTIIDTAVLARIANNQRISCSLSSVGSEYGFKKDVTVENYIAKHGLKREVVDLDGNKTFIKDFAKVPYDLISKYAKIDARICYDLYYKLLQDMRSLENYLTSLNHPKTLYSVIKREAELTKSLYKMERTGVLIEPTYTKRACDFERQRADLAAEQYRIIAKREFVDSGKAHAAAFIDAGVAPETLPRTSAGNYSFTGEILSANSDKLSENILQYRDADKKSTTFYGGFLKLRDSTGYIHTNFGQHTTRTFRLSSTGPNLQNVPSSRGDNAPYFERDCFIAPEGYKWLSLDYKSQEVRILYDLSGETDIGRRILDGEDSHQVVASMMCVTRKQAKTVQFGIIYGMGTDSLAKELDCEPREAAELKAKFFARIPRAGAFIRAITEKARRSGYIANTYGRVYQFEPQFAYKAPNYLIQGTGSEIVKDAVNAIFAKYNQKDILLVSQVHDELNLYIKNDMLDEANAIKQLMVNVYKQKFLPMDVDYKIGNSWGECK